jgi:hypothetical protein
LGEGNHAFIHRSGQSGGNIGEVAPVPFGRRMRRDQYRIVAPHHRSRSIFLRQCDDLRHRLVSAQCVGVERSGIAGNRELDDEGQRQRRHIDKGIGKRRGIAGPEHVAIDVFATEIHPVGFAAIRIGDFAVAGGQPRPEPAGEKCRYISAVARRYDHGPAILAAV